VKMLYVEDENGVPVDGHRATEIRRITRSIWVHLASVGKAPKSWMKADILTAEHYRREMKRHFPELQLCELDWKSDQIAIENYPSWHTNYFKEEIRPKSSDTDDSIHQNKRTQSPFLIAHTAKRKKLSMTEGTLKEASVLTSEPELITDINEENLPEGQPLGTLKV
jgi:hypothetical protein